MSDAHRPHIRSGLLCFQNGRSPQLSPSLIVTKIKELLLHKRGNSTVYPVLHNIKQYSSISILGVTIQSNCKFSLYVKARLYEANKCLFIIRSLRKEGYTPGEIYHLFNAIVFPKILYGLSVYASDNVTHLFFTKL